MGDTKKIFMSIDADVNQIYQLAHCIHGLCRLHGASTSESYQIQTAMVEAANNAILHAYASSDADSSNDSVDVIWQLNVRHLTLIVADRGEPMRSIPEDLPPDPGACNGRGWWIMRRWMDTVDYVSESGVNRVLMTRTLIGDSTEN